MRINVRFYLFAFFTLFVFIAWIVFHDNLLLNLWIGFLLLIVFSWISSSISLKDIQVNRYSRNKSFEIGKAFEEKMEIKNNSKIPKIWIEIKDHSELLSKLNSRVINNLGGNKFTSFTTTAILNQRGFYYLGPTELVSGDVFGFFKISNVFKTENYIIVYPKIIKLHRFSHEPTEKGGGAIFNIPTTLTTPQAAGVREYFPGDPLNRIHWPVSVKRDKLMVKEFDEETQANIWILMDTQQGMYIREKNELIEPAVDRNFVSIQKLKEYELPKDSFEYAVSIVASITKYFLEKDIMVGFASGSEPIINLQPEKGQRQLLKILDKLAVIKDDGRIPFYKLIEKQLKIITNRCLIILVSPTINEQNEINLLKLRKKGYGFRSIVFNAESFLPVSNNKIVSRKNQSTSVIQICFGDDLEKVLSVV